MGVTIAPRDFRKNATELARDLSYARGEIRHLRKRLREVEESRKRWRERALRRGL